MKHRVGYLIEHRGEEWPEVRVLRGQYTVTEAKCLLEDIIEEGMIAFQSPPLHRRDGPPMIQPFHEAMIEQIKDLLDDIESEKGDEIYEDYANRLCEIYNFHNARRILESLIQEKNGITASRENAKL